LPVSAKEGIAVGSPEDNPPNEATTTHGDTPGMAASKETEGWSQADRRMFAVTFYGGLAANVGVVLLVGVAIASIRFISAKSHPLWLQIVALLGLLIFGIISGIIIESIAPRLNTWQGIFIAFAGLGLLVLVGFAAGIGK
jgi:hypothetical protein